MDQVKKNPKNVELTVLLCDRSRYDNSLWSQFGLSVLLDCRWDGHPMRRILFDAGWESEPLLHNLERLGVGIETIDACVLSHCHYDHTGGLPGFLRNEKTRCQLIAHPEITRPVYSTRGELHSIGLDPSVFKHLSPNRLLLIEDPVEIYPGIWITGTIPRQTDFEKPEEGVYVLSQGKLIPDPERDDMALLFDLGEDGMVVVTGCAHAGIVNTLLSAQAILQKKKIHGLIGGIHLIDVTQDVRERTIRSLSEFEIERIWTGHCTGWEAEILLEKTFGGASKRFFTGDKFSLPLKEIVW